jgi:hypothetical protein
LQKVHIKPMSQSTSPFRVLGIALVVDQRGKGPRMVLRYPAAATLNTSRPNGLEVIDGSSRTSPTVSNGLDHNSHQIDSENELFFRLPPRQIAKLFRPKPSLCGQPMTLSVGRTVFCCCAVLMDDDETDSSSDVITQQTSAHGVDSLKKDDLLLFSVVVAMSATDKSQALPSSNWRDSGTDPYEMHYIQSMVSDEVRKGEKTRQSMQDKPSASFLSIRRVHVSLSRLCRILEREERRCRYVSLQANYFDKIREHLQKKWRQASSDRGVETTGNATNLSGTTAPQQSNHSASPSISSAKPSTGNHPGSERIVGTGTAIGSHRKTNSISVSFGLADRIEGAKISQNQALANESEERQKLQELEQEILETIMAASPFADDNDGGFHHQGNLAREFVQVYHALTRNDYDFPPTPSILLSGRDSVVYINRHVAVVIESVSDASKIDCSWLDTGNPVVRPYHALLFPTVTPVQLLESMTASRSVAPHRVQQFLRMINPRLTLSDIAHDTSLPLQSTLEIATYLVGQGLCFVFPKLSRKVNLACMCIQQIQEVKLAFSQHFGASINLFVLVSFLSNSDFTLGESMSVLATSAESHVVALRERLEASLPSIGYVTELKETVHTVVDSGPPEREARIAFTEKRDEFLFEIVVWLCSRRVLIPLQDYLVAYTSALKAWLATDNIGINNLAAISTEKQAQRNAGDTRGEEMDDANFLKKLLDLECLTGRVSVQACCWRTGVESTKLRALVNRCPYLRLVRRIPTKGDDWGVF